MQSNKEFYERINRDNIYTTENDPSKHFFYKLLTEFIRKWDLRNKKCLEMGSSKGLFQDLVDDYTGVDIAENLSRYYHKRFIPVQGANLPFENESFDAIFTYATYEHIPDLETALDEIIRVLKPGGVLLFAPAWHTRPWFAKGYQVRPYNDLTWREKMSKLSIPCRDFVLIRWPLVLLRRFLRLLLYLPSSERAKPLKYKKLKANYEVYWQSDSDACNSIDPFDVVLWFRSRNFICHDYNTMLKILLIRAYALELQKRL